MDTSWVDLPIGHPKYVVGCMNFINFAKDAHVEGKIICPCKKCKVEKWFPIKEVEGHILFKGFFKTYKNWFFHGNGNMRDRIFSNSGGSMSQGSLENVSGLLGRDDMEGLLESTFGVAAPSHSINSDGLENNEYVEESCDVLTHDSTETQDDKFKKLFEFSNIALYEGCTSFSKLSYLLHLFHLKCMKHWCIESFNMNLKLQLDAFPQMMEFPQNYYECTQKIKDLGLGYEKIHACPNDCCLYWGELLEKSECYICGTSRWKMIEGKDGSFTCRIGIPAKVMRYFPLIPRLKRMFMSIKTAEDMRWHEKRHLEKEDDGKLRHPADGLAWKRFDERYEEFSSDPRSVRLGLASDGFNPYRLMNSTYSTWPVVLIPYNLPPWLCMKQSSFILSMIIPGKSSPGNDIDVYLQPLVHELKLLWSGVDAYDAYTSNGFKLRAALLWTINDFPAYAMLSGLSTKGYKACPYCTHLTPCYRFGGRICYVGHRKWLPMNHPYRFQRERFDGYEERGEAPIRPTGTEILREQEKVSYVYGKAKNGANKKRKRKSKQIENEGDEDGDNDVHVFGTKRSIFFDLEYWEHNLLRHNLDVMHIEKNVCDNILGTLLNMEKSRDDAKGREALEQLGIKKDLWLERNSKGELLMPNASYSMNQNEIERFLKVVRKIRVPDGYSSNLSSCVNLQKRKLVNLKSHDNHVFMQDILPIALRASNSTKVIDLLANLSSFFKSLCSTTLHLNELDDLQDKIILILCEMEIEFLPPFFTSMVHLMIHLVEEVRLGGPVQYRWMYPIERYLSHLKSHVTNKAQPEGSIAEGYVLEETIIFCSRFLEGVKTVFNRPPRIDDNSSCSGNYLFNSNGRVVGKEVYVRLDEKSLKQAHRYVLLHTEEMNVVLDEFLQQKRQMNNIQDAINETEKTTWIINEFGEWLQNQAHRFDSSTEDGKLKKSLAGGINCHAKKLKGFMINGYKFLAMDRDSKLQTQNCGIMVEADGEPYYGKVKEIFELNYYGAYKVVLFRCDWVDIRRGVEMYPHGGVCVNFSKKMHTGRHLQDDPFVFSSQGKQVFYIEDGIRKGWSHVVKTKPRDLFDLGDTP